LANSSSNIEDVIAALQDSCEDVRRGDGTPYRSVSVKSILALSSQFKRTARQVEIIALQNDMIPERYSKNFTTFSAEDQIRLLNSKVCVIGVGGLGGWLAEMLARVGVGTIRLVDGDRFEDSNLNRQLFSSQDSIGSEKVGSAAKRIGGINSSVTVEANAVMLGGPNAAGLISGSDVVADCLDSIPARFVLQDATAAERVPLVSAAVGGRAGQLSTVMPGDAGLRTIYGPAEAAPMRGEEAHLGNPAFTVALVASLQCTEIIRILLTGTGRYVRNLLLVDLDGDLSMTVSL